MKYKNVIIESSKIIYNRVAIDSNKKIKILETKQYNENELIQLKPKYKKLRTVILISTEKLLFRKLQIPRVSDNALYNTSKFALEEYYPGENIKNYTIGFYINHSDSKNMYLFVWGIKKSLLESLLKKYYNFNIEYVVPSIVLPLHFYNNLKINNASALFFLIPNQVVFLEYTNYLKQMVVKIIPQYFYSKEELQNIINQQLIDSIKNFLNFNINSAGENNPSIYLYPNIINVVEKLKDSKFNIVPLDDNKVFGIVNLDGIAYISERENLIKEEFKKTEFSVKILLHLLFFMIIVLLVIVPLYFVNMSDYNKSKKLMDEVKKEFVDLYKSTTLDEWRDFHGSYKNVRQKIYDVENSLGISENFPIKFSGLQIVQKIFNIPQIKNIVLLNFFINITQKKCILKAITQNQQIIQIILQSLKQEGYTAQLSGTVIVKEDKSFEFEIIVKWEN